LLGNTGAYSRYSERVLSSLTPEAQRLHRQVHDASKIRADTELSGCSFDAVVSLLEYLLIAIRFSSCRDSIVLELCTFLGHASPFTLPSQETGRRVPWQTSLNRTIVFQELALNPSDRFRNFGMRHNFLQRQLYSLKGHLLHTVLMNFVRWLLFEVGERTFLSKSLPEENSFVVRIGASRYLVVHRNGLSWVSITLAAKACGLLREDSPQAFCLTEIARAAAGRTTLPHVTQVSWGRRSNSLRFRLSGSCASWPKWVVDNLRRVATYRQRDDTFGVTPETLRCERLPKQDALLLLTGLISARSSAIRRLRAWYAPKARSRALDSSRHVPSPTHTQTSALPQ
jgi:hypothetical protein